jgi:hypothetical protein
LAPDPVRHSGLQQRNLSLVDDVSTEPDSQRADAANTGPSEEALRADQRLAELEKEVAEKDELVTALTVQMEQLAEQLDRLQRTGADRKRGAAGGLPPELVESQKKIAGDLERVVQQWEDMQAGLALGRIEIQITELRDFIAERLAGGAPALDGPAGSAFPRLPSSIVLERVTLNSGPTRPIEEPAADSPALEAASSSAWESMKSKMLDESPAPSEPAIDLESVPDEEPPVPHAVNAEMATPSELADALDQRDAYIAYLLKKVRRLTPVPAPPDWLSLERVPEDLCQALQAQTKQLEEHLRMAEIELSMERARIGREQAQLRQQHELIEKQMRRLGLKSFDEAPEEHADVAPADRRWVRFLGIPKK